MKPLLKKCAQCSEMYEQGHRSLLEFTNSECCSLVCNGALQRSRKPALWKKCSTCGSDYSQGNKSITRFVNSKFCSFACSVKGREPWRVVPQKNCEICGVAYPIGPRRTATQYANSRFCSKSCVVKSLTQKPENVLARVEVNPQTGCHIWTGAKNPAGYGVIQADGRTQGVHKYVWESAKGKIPAGLQVDHLCNVRACCNIEHMEIKTGRENTLADHSNGVGAINARKTCCSKCGGEYHVQKNGYRACQSCRNSQRMQSYYRKKAAKAAE